MQLNKLLGEGKVRQVMQRNCQHTTQSPHSRPTHTYIIELSAAAIYYCIKRIL